MAFIDDVRKTTKGAEKAKQREARSVKAKESAAVRKSKNEGRAFARNYSFDKIKEAVKKAAKAGEKEYVAEVGDVSFESGYFSHTSTKERTERAFLEAEQKTLERMFKKEGFTVTPEEKHGSSKWDNDGCPTESYTIYKLKLTW